MISAKPLALAAAALSAGCAVLPRRAALNYTPSKNAQKAARQHQLLVTPFISRKPDARDIGRASAPGGLWTVPLRAKSDPGRWATAAVEAELAAAGYELVGASSEWKVGGLLQDVSCGAGARTICAVKLEGWVTMKDGWQAFKRDYSGEGLRPPLLPGEDPYELSLEDALREVLSQFRRDVEMNVP